ncbi:MAG: stage II sporulation protein E, partial [Acutalibacteraceae bacterium]
MRGKTMEHAQKRKINFKGILTSSRTKRIALYALYFLAGLLGSRGMVFVRYAPFGAAAVAAVPIRSMWAVIAGSLVGYIWPSNAMHPIRYIAAIIAIAIIRCILNELVKIRSHPLFAPVVCFVPMLVTGIAMAFINGVTVNSITMYSAEAMLSAAGAYFFQRTSSLITSKRGVGTLNTGELACVVLSLGVAILALDNIAVYDISLGDIKDSYLILFFNMEALGGAIAGTATGVMLGLTTSGLSYISGAYAFAGLMAGLFAPLGKVALILVFILANAIGSLQIGNQMYMINGLYEVLAATLIYIIWPTKIGGKFIALFRQPVDLLHTDGLRRAVTMRLGFAAKALDDVTQSVDEVSKRLAVVNAQDSDQVYTNAVEESRKLDCVCAGKNQPETVQALQSSQILGEKSSIGIEDFPGFFVSRCGRVNELAQNINHKYKEMQIRESAEKRVSQIRAMVMNQFETTSEMMRDFAQELELYERFDYDATQRINQVLHESAIIPIDVSCRIDRYNRMSVEIETPTLDQKKIGRTKLAKEISKVCGRRFEPPMISIIKDRCRIQMSEKPVYRIQFGVAQHACDNAQLCG